jgi:uncharacterized protein
MAIWIIFMHSYLMIVMEQNKEIDKIRDELVKSDPFLILLFGSQINGKTDIDSDIDLLVVTKDNYIPENFREKTELYLKVNRYIREIVKKIPVDLLVITYPSYQELIRNKDAFIQEIVNKGVVLYESKHTAMA